MTNEEMRNKTGNETGDMLDGFIYVLLRDHITPGKMEGIVEDLERSEGKPLQFTNGYLAKYAKILKERII